MALGTDWTILNTSVFSGVSGWNKVHLRTYARLISQSIDNNSSVVEIKTTTWSDASGYTSYQTYFTASGCTTYNPGYWSWATSEEIVIDRYGDQLITYQHNDDGTKSVSGTSTGVAGGMGASTSHTWSFDLPSIPRASVPTMSTNDIIVNGTGSTIIYTNRKTAYYHKIEYVFGSLTGIIGTGVETQISWTPSTELLAQIPNAKTGTGTIKCTTYKEQACTTQVGTPQTCSYTLRTDETICVPTITGVTLTEQDAKALAVETTGQFIRYISDILVGGTATANYYATLSSVKVVCGAFTYTASSTIAISITDITDNSIKIVATDSRGYQTTVTTDFTLIQYVKPTVINTSYRQTATDGKIILKSDGAYFTGSLGQVDNSYTMTYKYRQKVGGTWAEYSTGTTALTLSASGTSYSIEQLLGETFDYRYPCELVISLEDKLTTATGTKVIAQGIPITSEGLLSTPHFDIYGDLKVHDSLDPTTYTVGYAFSKDFIEKWKGIIGGGLTLENLLLAYAHPIGSYYWSDEATEPSTLFGGTWVRVKGFVIGGINEDDTDTDTHTSFNQSAGTIIGSKHLQEHYHVQTIGTEVAVTGGGDYATTETYSGSYSNSVSSYTTYGQKTITTGTGDSQNIQPTRLTYCWRRTA